MYGKVDLVVETPVERDQPFRATVKVTQAQPGGDVTIVLEQKRGAEPFMTRLTTIAVADDTGTAFAEFQPRLAGPAWASLLARAYDSFGPHFEPDVEAVEVR